MGGLQSSWGVRGLIVLGAGGRYPGLTVFCTSGIERVVHREFQTILSQRLVQKNQGSPPCFDKLFSRIAAKSRGRPLPPQLCRELAWRVP